MKNYLFSMLAFLFAGVSMQAETAACGAPTNVQIQRISDSSAIIDADGGSLYDIYINVPGGYTPTASTGPNHGLNDLTFPYTSNILNAQFGYHIWVRSQCSGETSAWVGPFVVDQFDASCTVPSNILINRTSDTEATMTADAGIYDIYLVAEGNAGPSDVFTGPNVYGDNDVDLSTPYTRTDLAANVAYDVYFRTQCNASQVSEWVGPYNIPVYSAPCDTPMNVVVTRTSDTSATITADDLSGTYDIYAVKHGVAGPGVNDGPNGYGANDVSFPLSRSPLAPTIDYDIYVRMDCGNGDTSEWVGPFYLPLYSPACVAPNASDVILTRTSSTSATIDGLSNDFTYQGTANRPGRPLRPYPMYGMDNMSMPYTQTVIAGFDYDFWLRTDCGDGTFSDWTGPMYLANFNAPAKSMSLYPNPAVALVRIEGTQAVSVQVIGMSGKVELSTKVVNNEINLDGLAPGQYIIQATDAQGNVTTSKLMKK